VWPKLEDGPYPVKRTVGQTVDVWADIFRDGHERLTAVVRHRRPGERTADEIPMQQHISGRWTTSLYLEGPGRHEFDIEARVDRVASWRDELMRKVAADQEDLSSELVEGAALIAARMAQMKGDDRKTAKRLLAVMASDVSQDRRIDAALDPDLDDALARHPDRAEVARLPTRLEIDVDRELARFGTWYELFPRSWGGFAGVEQHLPRFAELGVDVLYFPPIHPIGHTHRKGPNNSLTAGPDDPGSPWAIGDESGGHTAIHPDLGTPDDFRRLVDSAAEHGIEIALDIALQCSPDHPWLVEHPEWFSRRPDGTLKYAENPPKKYQDIYNLNFDSDDWRGLWQALRDVLLHWVSQGVRIFRVDNPHTKPLGFWEWVIREVRAVEPDTVFLSEAFTRPQMMYALAKAGFSQSYTYFTWRNSRWEIADYFTELGTTEVKEFFRPNLFANTPDILHEYLQHGGRAGFEVRLVLAATLGPNYGIYSGFENCEGTPVHAGSEEYLNSEKYEIKHRELDGVLLPLYEQLNAIRRAQAAFQYVDDITFLETENDALVAYAKGATTGRGTMIVCVNLDPHAAQAGGVHIPEELDLPHSFQVRDLLTDQAYSWNLGRNYLGLDPRTAVAHVFRVET
jgi:starch synthase (maltosyl-transferring)